MTVQDCTHEVGPDGPHGLKLVNVDCNTRRRFESAIAFYEGKYGVDRTTAIGMMLDDAKETQIARVRAAHKTEMILAGTPGAEVRK